MGKAPGKSTARHAKRDAQCRKPSKTGKVKLNSANRRHDIKGCKSTKRKRHLRKAFMAGSTTAPTLKRLVPYK